MVTYPCMYPETPREGCTKTRRKFRTKECVARVGRGRPPTIAQAREKNCIDAWGPTGRKQDGQMPKSKEHSHVYTIMADRWINWEQLLSLATIVLGYPYRHFFMKGLQQLRPNCDNRESKSSVLTRPAGCVSLLESTMSNSQLNRPNAASRASKSSVLTCPSNVMSAGHARTAQPAFVASSSRHGVEGSESRSAKPLAQSSHDVALSAECCPMMHAVHGVAALESRSAVPAGQAEHEVPLLGAYEPGLHARHGVEASESRSASPAAHAVHDIAAWAE